MFDAWMQRVAIEKMREKNSDAEQLAKHDIEEFKKERIMALKPDFDGTQKR